MAKGGRILLGGCRQSFSSFFAVKVKRKLDWSLSREILLPFFPLLQPEIILTSSNKTDRLPDITHIVFVVHGVGQVVDDTTIIRNTNLMRDNVQGLMAKHFPGFQKETSQRVEFFPVEWRSSLRLDEGMVKHITPQRIMGLRNLLNSSAMDIMYYTSPLFR